MWSDPSTSQPPTRVVKRNPIEQHLPGKTMPQRVGPNTSAMTELDALCGPKNRLLHLPPDRHAGHFDQSALANDPETGGGHHTLYFGGPSRPG